MCHGKGCVCHGRVREGGDVCVYVMCYEYQICVCRLLVELSRKHNDISHLLLRLQRSKSRVMNKEEWKSGFRRLWKKRKNKKDITTGLPKS